MLRTTLTAALVLAASGCALDPALAADPAATYSLPTELAVDAPDGTLPDHSLTPGGTRTQDKAAICDTKTSTVRNVSGSMKEQVYRRYGYQTHRDKWCNTTEGCEVDHLVSLELGGSNEIENLWIQPYEGSWNAHDKDRLENELHKRVCAGRMDVVEAQTAIARDWKVLYVKVFGRIPDGEGQ